jgi:urea-proton symporter
MNVGSALGLLAIYGLIMVVISLFLNKSGKGFEGFIVANRNVKTLVASFSIAATWIWAPALFVSAQKAYQQGLVGFGWFFIPNVLTLIFFGIASIKIRDRFLNGYTLPDVMFKEYGAKAHSIYLIQFSVLQVCSFAVQLLAGAAIVGWLTGISFFIMTMILAAVALSYSLISGMKASVVTDFIQMAFILIVALIAVPFVVNNAGGFPKVLQGISGLNGTSKFFSPEGIQIMLTFGIINTVGLLAGPFGDQTFWQRTFSIKKDKVRRSFIYGGLVFAIVPLLFALLGFIGAADGIKDIDPQLINIIVLQKYLPPVIVPLVIVLIISGLASTLDSNLCAISSLVNVDFAKRIKGDISHSVKLARIAMLVLAVLGIAIANIPGLKILHLFLFYGTLRAATLLPTLITIFGKKLYGESVFWGIVTSLVIGLPIFVIGKLMGNWQIALTGNLITVFASGVVAYTWSRIRRSKV